MPAATGTGSGAGALAALVAAGCAGADAGAPAVRVSASFSRASSACDPRFVAFLQLPDLVADLREIGVVGRRVRGGGASSASANAPDTTTFLVMGLAPVIVYEYRRHERIAANRDRPRGSEAGRGSVAEKGRGSTARVRRRIGAHGAVGLHTAECCGEPARRCARAASEQRAVDTRSVDRWQLRRRLEGCLAWSREGGSSGCSVRFVLQAEQQEREREGERSLRNTWLAIRRPQRIAAGKQFSGKGHGAVNRHGSAEDIRPLGRGRAVSCRPAATVRSRAVHVGARTSARRAVEGSLAP